MDGLVLPWTLADIYMAGDTHGGCRILPCLYLVFATKFLCHGYDAMCTLGTKHFKASPAKNALV